MKITIQAVLGLILLSVIWMTPPEDLTPHGDKMSFGDFLSNNLSGGLFNGTWISGKTKPVSENIFHGSIKKYSLISRLFPLIRKMIVAFLFRVFCSFLETVKLTFKTGPMLIKLKFKCLIGCRKLKFAIVQP
jgi:hypothetical protein